MLRVLSLLAITSATLALSTGCSGTTIAVACHVDSDCASGTCRSDGTCAPLLDAGSTPDAGSIPDAGPSSNEPDGGSIPVDAGAPTDAGPAPLCADSADGSITRAQFPVSAGLHATYAVSDNATVDTQGTALADGGYLWDFTAALAGDTMPEIDTDSLDGGWFQGDFPTGTYTAILSPGSNLLGIFEAASTNLLLLGVVSPTSGTSQTELTYDPPVVVVQFPITPGATWQTTSTVSGMADGIDSLYVESYSSTVDETGDVLTPYASFAAQRVQTVLTRTVAGIISGQTTYIYETACFGGVATVVSQLDLGTTNFTNASLFERLAP